LVKRKIGLLPASGSASRLNGIPKFALPYNSEITLIEWHVQLMLEVVDEVRICSRASWVPLLKELGIDQLVSIISLEPSTMNDALFHLANLNGKEKDADYIVGMPDTVLVQAQGNPYEKLSSTSGAVSLLATPFREELRGKVGQLKFSSSNLVEEIKDKDPKCNYGAIWSAFRMSGYPLEREDKSPSYSFQRMLESGDIVLAVESEGEYFDLGSLTGLKEYYSLPTTHFLSKTKEM
jgi:hypothetical protein